MTEPLTPEKTKAVLAFLGVASATPDFALLDALIAAYGRRVPWESASRIAKRARTPEPARYPRWSAEFWQGAIARGTGGTCFESNHAFFALLRALGYKGYLTINNMGASVGCHTAVVVELGAQRWLVDAGYPLYAALPLDQHRPTERVTPLFTYTIRPVAPDEYIVENRPHPTPYLFNLIDRPVPDADYRRATTADYGPKGRFLNRPIIRKVIGEQVWRFDSDARPYHVQTFRDGQRFDYPIERDLAGTLSAHYGIDEGTLAVALQVLGI